MKDFLIDTALELQIADGDFVIDDSDGQHQQLLLMAEKGSFKEFPDTGVGLFSFLESEDTEAMYTEIRRQFAADGMQVKEIGSVEGKLRINAPYK